MESDEVVTFDDILNGIAGSREAEAASQWLVDPTKQKELIAAAAAAGNKSSASDTTAPASDSVHAVGSLASSIGLARQQQPKTGKRGRPRKLAKANDHVDQSKVEQPMQHTAGTAAGKDTAAHTGGAFALLASNLPLRATTAQTSLHQPAPASSDEPGGSMSVKQADQDPQSSLAALSKDAGEQHSTAMPPTATDAIKGDQASTPALVQTVVHDPADVAGNSTECANAYDASEVAGINKTSREPNAADIGILSKDNAELDSCTPPALAVAGDSPDRGDFSKSTSESDIVAVVAMPTSDIPALAAKQQQMPPGWTIRERERKSGATQGRVDYVYVSPPPDSRMFDSWVKAQAYITAVQRQ
eukprot:jgi/Chrzof1/12162/Cz06g23120.t1